MASELRILLVLLALSFTDAIHQCNKEKDECDTLSGIKDTRKYTFMNVISDTYEAFIDCLVSWQKGTRESLDDAEVAVENYKDDIDNHRAKYAKSDNVVDDVVKQAQDFTATVMDVNKDFFDMDYLTDIMKEAMDLNDKEDTLSSPEGNAFEYPPMHRLDPGDVGEIRTVELTDGRKTFIKTLAKQPPLFEIEKFLTEEECDQMLEVSLEAGLTQSGIFQNTSELEKDRTNIKLRNSKSAVLEPPLISEDFVKRIHARISSITKIPAYIIEGSEPIDIGYYEVGGFYAAHLDSNEASRKTVPCCFQSACKDSSGEEQEAMECCTLCRYATFLYYLTDVEEGGETAFPFADLSLSKMMTMREEIPDLENLTAHCYDASVVVKPVKGKAIFWYNHLVDGNGYLGGVDKRSYHGGCNVRKGSKWIATNWISSPIFPHRFKPSRYRDITESYRRHLGL